MKWGTVCQIVRFIFQFSLKLYIQIWKYFHSTILGSVGRGCCKKNRVLKFLAKIFVLVASVPLIFVISFLMFVRWKRIATAKRSLEANLNELITTIWEIQIKWWSVSLNLGLVNICSYSIRITIETFTNLKQILEKGTFGKNELLKIWKLNFTKEESN